MPNDDFDDNDEVGPLPGREPDAPGRKSRREPNRQNRAAGKQAGTARDPNLLQENTSPPMMQPLPTGTAYQVELLLAKRQRRLQSLFIRLGLFV